MFYKRIEFNALVGENIHHYAARAHQEMQKYKKTTYGVYLAGDFNGIRMIITKDSTPQAIVQDYHCRLDDKCLELKNLKKCQINDLEQAQYQKMLQFDVNVMLNNLENRNFEYEEELLYWIKDFVTLIHEEGVSFNKDKVIKKFFQLGYNGLDINYDKYVSNITDYPSWIIEQTLYQLIKEGIISLDIIKHIDKFEELKISNEIDREI